MTGALADRARTLAALHVPGDPLLLANVWDVAGARTVAGHPGCRALATASWAMAAAHGEPDGEALALEVSLAMVARITAAVTQPVSVDLEGGFGDAGAAVAAALEAGAVGANLEDGIAERELRPAGDHAAAVAAARAVADRAGVAFVINARTDAFLVGAPGALEEAVARGRAYLDAGADCVFVPGVADVEVVGRLVAALGKVSVLAVPGGPSPGELAAAGVCRVSTGPFAMRHTLAALAGFAGAVLAGRPLPATPQP